MVAVCDLVHITSAMRATLEFSKLGQKQIADQLQTSGATGLVNNLRTFTTLYSIICVGGFSIFEAGLKLRFEWERPFNQLDVELRTQARNDLADRFKDYRDAVNVLKHGTGPSYDRLLERRNTISFKILGKEENFFDEGDVSALGRLIDADSNFVEGCAACIEEIVDALDARL